MPDRSRRQSPATSAGKNQRRLSPRSHCSRINQAWSRQTESGYANFLCPICGAAVRYCLVRGNLSPVIECSNDACRWTVDELVRDDNTLELAQKPKGISSRQWYEASRVVG